MCDRKISRHVRRGNYLKGWQFNSRFMRRDCNNLWRYRSSAGIFSRAPSVRVLSARDRDRSNTRPATPRGSEEGVPLGWCRVRRVTARQRPSMFNLVSFRLHHPPVRSPARSEEMFVSLPESGPSRAFAQEPHGRCTTRSNDQRYKIVLA